LFSHETEMDFGSKGIFEKLFSVKLTNVVPFFLFGCWVNVDLDVGCAKEQGVCAKCRCRVERIVGRFVFEKFIS
jgi:hypothetical protein